MSQREPSVWRLIVCATPPRLLIDLMLHLLLHPNERVPADLQRRIAAAWARNA